VPEIVVEFDKERICKRKYRSKGEQQIALLLERNGIVYHYEYPLALMDDSKVKIYYPDFTLPDYGVIVEYLGYQGNPEYDRKTGHKIEAYRKAGIESLVLNSDSFKGDWPEKIMGRIESMLRKRVERFYDRKGYNSHKRQ
jgi:hypothetical protein